MNEINAQKCMKVLKNMEVLLPLFNLNIVSVYY